MGDVAYLEGEGEEGEGRSSRASTPAEATRRMLERRGFSKKINYRLLESLYGEEGADEAAKSKAEGASRSQSRSQSVASGRSVSVDPEAATPRRRRLVTPSTTAKPASPAPAAGPARGPAPAAPAPANEEVLGPVPDAKHDEEGDDDEYDDEDEGEYPDDGVDAAFEGNYGDYYGDSDDYGSD